MGDYYAILRGMWHELSIYQPLNPCCVKEHEKYLEVQHIYDLLGGLNPEYETVWEDFKLGSSTINWDNVCTRTV